MHFLDNGPWIIMGRYPTVTTWRPNFRPSSDRVTFILAWIWLPKIPIEPFDEDLLMKIGNKIGRVVKMDHTTMSVTKGRFVRVCVQIDLMKRQVLFIELSGHLQKVEYEGLHIICFECGGYNHRRDNCPRLVKEKALDSVEGQ